MPSAASPPGPSSGPSTVHLVPAGSDRAPDARPGDYLVRPGEGGLFEVGRVDGGCTWIGTVAAGLLPPLPEVDAPQPAPDQTALLTAVEGVAVAEHLRGG